MAQFHFPLEKVLRWRALQLATEEAKLKVLLQEQVNLQTKRAQIGSEAARLTASLATLENLRGQDFQTATAYSFHLKLQAYHLTLKLSQCEKRLAAQKKEHHNAQRRVRVLEQLKDKQLRTWTYEETRQLEMLASESYLAHWGQHDPL
jgi:hypothetical protein